MNPRRMAILGVAVVAAAVLAAGCAAPIQPGGPNIPAPSPTSTIPEPTTTTPQVTTEVTTSTALDGRTFVSTAVTGRQLVPETAVRISFANGMITASAGCNTISGGVAMDGDVLSTSTLAMTAMGCPDALGEQDQWLQQLLASGATWTLKGDTLTISKGGDSITMREQTGAPLKGTTWTLTTLVTGETASSVPTGLSAGVTIADGRIGVRTSCNAGSATVEIGDGSMVIGPLALTRMACTSESAPIEKQMVAVLQGTVRYSIDGSRLTITHPDGKGLQFFTATAAEPAPPIATTPPGGAGGGSVSANPPHVSASELPPETTPAAAPGSGPVAATPGPITTNTTIPPTGTHRITVNPPHDSIPPQPPSR